MKLCFVNTNIGYGGASKMMVWTANMLAGRDHDVTFIVFRDDTLLQSVSNKVKVEYLKLEPLSGNGKGIFNTIFKMRKYIRSNKFDLAIAFLIPTQLRLALACKGLKTRLLFSHRGDPYQPQPGMFSKVTNWAFRQADHYVFQTEEAQKFFSNRIQEHGRVIPNPIKPLIRTTERDNNVEKRIVSVARLDIKQKRQDLLIEAFNIISPDFPDYILELYGDGPDEEKLRELAQSNPRIRFMGKTSDVISAIQNAALHVLSSDFEGIPNALLEAMSLGVPSVSTDCSPGGARLLINSYENGIITPRGDAKQLAEAMRFMLENPEKAEAMGRKGMDVNERFSEAAIARQWLDLISEIEHDIQGGGNM